VNGDDSAIKLAVYRLTADSGSVPDSAQVAESLGLTDAAVLAAFQRLQSKRLLFLEPGDPSRIRMAPPFSGVATAFPVHAQGKSYWANCVWDAFGVAAALHADAVSPAVDAYTGEPLLLEVKNGQAVSQPYVAHFAVPAAHWWDDIVFT
jgi:hypothetical protein